MLAAAWASVRVCFWKPSMIGSAPCRSVFTPRRMGSTAARYARRSAALVPVRTAELCPHAAAPIETIATATMRRRVRRRRGSRGADVLGKSLEGLAGFLLRADRPDSVFRGAGGCFIQCQVTCKLRDEGPHRAVVAHRQRAAALVPDRPDIDGADLPDR